MMAELSVDTGLYQVHYSLVKHWECEDDHLSVDRLVLIDTLARLGEVCV